MIAALVAALMFVSPVKIDLPPKIAAPAAVTAPAASNGRCVGYEPLLRRYSPGWNVTTMSRIAYRESRCRAGVRNWRSGSTGLFQVMPSNRRYIAARLHEGCSAAKLRNASFNNRAAAVLFRYDGYGPWAQ